jgi:hypothetical protein
MSLSGCAIGVLLGMRVGKSQGVIVGVGVIGVAVALGVRVSVGVIAVAVGQRVIVGVGVAG